MDVGGTDEESSLFRAFTVPSMSTENRNVNKTSDPISKESNLPDLSLSTHDDTQQQHEQPKATPPEPAQFEQYSKLPFGLRSSIADFIGTPVDDIDKSYKDKQTFIVVNSNYDLFRFSSTNALYLFSPNNIIRRTAICTVTHPYWATFIILTVLANCLYTLSVQADKDVPFELIFFIIYVVEMIVKVLARGLLLSSFSYLRDAWNCFDLFLIIVALVAICINPQDAIYGRPILVELRVLKIVSNSLCLRRTFQLYWKSLLALRDLLLYILYCMIIISVLCVQLYMGVLTQRCVKAPLTNLNDADWSSFTTDRANFFYEGGSYRACGNSSGSQLCPTNYVCLRGNSTNPNYGFSSFDTVYRSFFVVFRVVQRDFWEETMQYLIAAAGPWHIFLFVALIYIVSFQLCALIWSPIAVVYNYLRDEQWEKDLLNDLDKIEERPASEATNKNANLGCWAKFQRIAFNIIYNPFAVLFVIICILLNTLFMALDHHDMDVELEKILRVGNYFFMLVFVIEAVLKILALGPIRYFRDTWNTFDFTVVALGLIEMGLEGVQGLSVLRSFRLLRPLRLAKIIPAFSLLMSRARHLFSAVGNQTIILCMFIYIFVVFGCRAYGQNYVDKVHQFYGSVVPRWNFTDPFHSFMIVFRSLCGEWIESLFDCLLVSDGTSVIYFCALALVGSFAIMHLFVALLLTNDDSAAIPNTIDESSGQQSNSQQLAAESMPTKFNLHAFLKDKLLEPYIKQIYDDLHPIKSDGAQQAVDNAAASEVQSGDANLQVQNNDVIVEVDGQPQTTTATKDIVIDARALTVAAVEPANAGIAPVATVEETDDDDDAAKVNESTKWSKCRVKLLKFNENKYFQYVVVAIVLIASVTLAYDIHNFSLALTGSSLVELAFCIVMIIESISKIISCGWKSYFKNIWCLIDLFNTVVAVFGLFIGNQTILILKSLRPISLVSRCTGLKIIATTIARQIQTLFNSLVICAAFWLIFAIMGVQMFAGKFYHCVDKNQTRLDTDFVPDRSTCIAKNYTWTNSPVNFDNILQAYLSLLQVATFKGWIQIIYDAIDSRSIDMQPIREVNIYMFLYFVVFIVIGVFICANLIVGILVKQTLIAGPLSDLFPSSTKPAKSKPDHDNLISDNDENSPDETVRSKLADFARTKQFEWIAFVACLIFIVNLSFDHYEANSAALHVLNIIDFITALLFIIETGLRLHSLRRQFLLRFWNFFDAVTLIFVVIGMFMAEFGAYVLSPAILRVIRVIRFNSLFVNYSKQLKLALGSLRKSRSAAWHLGAFLFFMICVYALIGIAAFRRATNIFPINDTITFRNFGPALLLIFQISTSAAWDGVYEALISDSHKSRILVALYLLSFLFICILVIVNLMTTVIVNYYLEATEEEDEVKALRASDANDFDQKWQTVAGSENPLVIQKAQLGDLLGRLAATSALRLNDVDNESIKLLGIPLRNKDQYYRGDVLIALNKERLRRSVK